MLFRQNNFCMGAALGSQYGAMTVAGEILIAQLHSQSKLTTAWHENRKIWYENQRWAKLHASVTALQITSYFFLLIR
jgi:hypothetical protein